MKRLSTAFYKTFKPIDGGKEWLGADGRDEYDFGPRALSATGRLSV